MTAHGTGGRGTVAVVMGAGSWGTTVAKVLADTGCAVRLWARRTEVAHAIDKTRENAEYLPGVVVPQAVRPTDDAMTAMLGADLVFLAIPAQTLRSQLEQWASDIPERSTVVSLVKGVELHTGLRMSEVIVEAGKVEPERVAVLSGPNLACEVAAEQPTATVVACPDAHRTQELQRALSNRYLRPYTNTDVIGCELGGAVKNVIALACGLVQGLGFGDNTRASLITRGLAETTRLGVTLGADPLTFAGLAGLGDLIATCSSPLSRNRSFGELVGRGASFGEAHAATHQTVEGVASCLAIRELAQQHGVEMPLTEQVARICHEGLDPHLALQELMARVPKAELG